MIILIQIFQNKICNSKAFKYLCIKNLDVDLIFYYEKFF